MVRYTTGEVTPLKDTLFKHTPTERGPTERTLLKMAAVRSAISEYHFAVVKVAPEERDPPHTEPQHLARKILVFTD